MRKQCMRFSIKDYPGRYIMHCKTKEEAQIFTEYLHSIGKTWISNKSYLEYDGFVYGETSCYNFNKGTHADIYTYTNLKYTILEFTDFDWDDDMKLGDNDTKNFDNFMSQFKIN